MNYLQRLREIKNTKETKKVFIDRQTKESNTTETKETNKVPEELLPPCSTTEKHDLDDTKKAPPDLLNKPLTPPLLAGWLVVYCGLDRLLHGGFNDREHGTVETCEWDGTAWTVLLTDGQRLPLKAITGVSKTDAQGRIVAGWEVKRHGYDGEGQ